MRRFARWCNGSTADSESVCHGSNPCRAATSFVTPHDLVSPLFRDAFAKRFIAHHYWRRATTGEAFDKFYRELSVLGCLRPVLLRVQSQLPAKVLVQLVRTAQGAAQRPANTQMIFSHGFELEHRIECNQLVDIDRLQFQFGSRPFDRLARKKSEMLLERMEQHHGRAALHRVMRDQLIDF